jgi:hypothetical protein
MTEASSKSGSTRDLEDVLEEKPESKHGEQGQAANGGEQAGANSDDAGRPIAPQTGSPGAGDRRG